MKRNGVAVNPDIEEYIKASGIKKIEIARHFNMPPNTFSDYLNRELCELQKLAIKNAIREIKIERSTK